MAAVCSVPGCGKTVSKPTVKTCRAHWRMRGADLAPHERAAEARKPTERFEVTGDTAEVTKLTSTAVRTLADLIRVCEIDTREWVVKAWECKAYQQASIPRTTREDGDTKWVRPDTEPIVTQLFSVRASLALNRPVIDATAQIDALIADAKAQIKPRPNVKRPAPGACMLEVSIPDLHLGKLAWNPETGGANYDSKIAARVFMEAVEALIARTSAFTFDRVVFPVGNDFYHADNKHGTTTRGTQLDVDSRYHKMFIAGRRLITEAIERLRRIAPVSVVIVAGNHDSSASFHLGDSLDCYYHNTPDVDVMNEPNQRKYVSYGRNLILFTHGHTGKKQNLPLLMATERPDLFGQALYREAHVGHTHELRVQEHMGVRVRVSPALCSPDAWHSEMQFVGNLRGAEAFVWSKHEGIVAMANYTVSDAIDRSQAS